MWRTQASIDYIARIGTNLTHVCFRKWIESATLKWAKARICHPKVGLKHDDLPLRKVGLKLIFDELFQFK